MDPDQATEGVLPVLLPALALLMLATAYLLLARRARRRNPAKGWNRWRTAGFLTGLALLGLALLPPLAELAHADFRGSMAQHMLLGMYAPLGLMLGAPATLLLRTLPTARARQLTTFLHSRYVRFISRPATALVLSSGSLFVLYFTPLYEATATHPVVHWLIHLHSIAAGCLFTYVIAGPDPAPDRPGVPVRLAYLGATIALHAALAQLIYGGHGTRIQAPVEQVQGGAEILYYSGDIAELLLAIALIATWRSERRLRPARVDHLPDAAR
ncbi:cytochrome c oxidase assembly protein [Amycolatopsis cynarae]|uniref:Cytochrome c oxidase assembly protein n=1 Tax=Amycolatopsis cynarae TaxID=2995223 RepID=A0ABY7BD81_9PSEU|nr:cytochrome c oxidase assembly protein [Amycolatopsis sp. HUAS 11-8]WAL69103.1 cytochrome c oxidase assembly protein [Amycolatopsis sp. HUAS 11-8]